jgi:hypothetical protein
VSLTTTDDLGVSSTATQSVNVAPAPVVEAKDDGGGALGAEWLLLLLGATLGLGGIDRGERRRAARLNAAARGQGRD